MKKTIVLAALILFAFTGIAQAHTKAEWDRSVESDVAFYRVYVCVVKGCVVTQTPAMLQAATIPHPAVGVATFMLPLGKEGTVGVSVVDKAGNESEITVSPPFDTIPPAKPNPVRLN